MKFEEVKVDYLRMCELLSDNTEGEGIYDWCGAFCNCEKFDELLLNPSKSVSRKIMIDAIEYAAQAGASGGDRDGRRYFESDELMSIFEKYDCYISGWPV